MPKLILLVCLISLGGCFKKEAPLLPDIDPIIKQRNETDRRRHTTATDDQINEFINKIKEASLKKDKAAFAKLLIYPCYLSEGKQKTLIKDEAQFLEIADRVMQPLAPLIAQIRLDDLFVNYVGFMVGNNEMWFDPLKGIISFNLPYEPKPVVSWNPTSWSSQLT